MGFSTTRSNVFLTVFSTVCVTLLVTVLTSFAALLLLILVLELLVGLFGADFVRFVPDARVFEVVVLEVVLVVGSLNPVYSSHFGPMTSLMPPQISSLFVDEVDGVDLTDEDEDAESDFVDTVVPLAVFFQISNIPLSNIQDEVIKNVPEIKKYKVGLLHLFIQHTSAGLTLNEYYSPPHPISWRQSLILETGIQMSAKT